MTIRTRCVAFFVAMVVSSFGLGQLENQARAGGVCGKSYCGPFTVQAAGFTYKGKIRDAKLYLPQGSEHASRSLPLVILLHPYGGSGRAEAFYFREIQNKVSNSKQPFALLIPEATVNSKGKSFWNISGKDLNDAGEHPDDDGYLMGLIAQVRYEFSEIDPGRIYFIGHSSGGFMSYRMACEHSELVAGIASLAGTMLAPEQKYYQCKASSPVSILQIHALNDPTVKYEGGSIAADAQFNRLDHYLGALETVQHWQKLNDCRIVSDDPTQSAEAFQLLFWPTYLFRSKDTLKDTIAFTLNCKEGTQVSLWNIKPYHLIPGYPLYLYSSHYPWLASDATDRILDFLFKTKKNTQN